MNMGLGKFDEALQWEKKALALNPMIPYSYVGVGWAYLDLCDDAKATEWCNKALALQPDLTDAQFLLGVMHLERKEYQQAMDQAQKILALQADDPSGLSLAGAAALLSADYAQAEQYLAKSMAIDSTSGTTSLGYIYMKTGRKDKAGKMLARSLKHDEEELEKGNESNWIPYDLAEINSMHGNKVEAYRWPRKGHQRRLERLPRGRD